MQVEEKSAGHMLVDPDHAVPRHVRVHFQLDQPKFFVRLFIQSKNGRHTVQSLEVRPGWLKEDGSFSDADAGITTTNLRQLLIDRLVRTAMDAVRQPVARLSGEEREFQRLTALRTAAIYPNFGITDDNVDQYVDTLFRVPGETSPAALEIGGVPTSELRGRGRETPNDRIVKAAELYQQLVAAGSAAPIKEVGIALGYSASQASRYLKAARERGLLRDVKPTD